MNCRKCGEKIPSRIIIDGKERVLSSRKFCLDCSPFNGHNTTKDLVIMKGQECICQSCNRKFIFDRKKTHRILKCNSCVVKERRFLIKKKAILYKGGKCQKCGYNKYMGALDFHHIGKNKKFSIGGSYNRSWKIIQEELDKCELLCTLCHREEHYGNEITLIGASSSG